MIGRGLALCRKAIKFRNEGAGPLVRGLHLVVLSDPSLQRDTLWLPIYEAQGLVKVVTAVIAVTTAVLIYPHVSKARAIPSLRQLQFANAQHLIQVWFAHTLAAATDLAAVHGQNARGYP
jgi:hypothetical protein